MVSSLQQLRALVQERGIRVVVSDLDGVLRVFDQGLWSEMDRVTGTPEGTAYAAVLGNPYLDEVVRGRGTHRQWRRLAVSELVAAGSSPRAAHTAIRTWLSHPGRVDAEVLAQLEALRGSGFGVFVLTNGTDRVPEELDDLGLTGLLGQDHRFLLNTADLGAAKPDHEAYRRARARIEEVLDESVRPEQIVLLDDSPRHVRGAVSCGWHAVLHVGL